MLFLSKYDAEMRKFTRMKITISLNASFFQRDFSLRRGRVTVSVMLIDFLKVLLGGSHLTDNGIYCSIINIGDVNSY